MNASTCATVSFPNSALKKLVNRGKMLILHKDGSFSYTGIRGKVRRPWVQWKHVDGPMLCCCDGSIHWLTWKERFLLWIGRITVESLDPMWDEELFGAISE
jgi:hypothetical protein